MKMMEKAGYAKRGESDAGEEWITVDEDGSDLTKDKMKDALAGYVRYARLFFCAPRAEVGRARAESRCGPHCLPVDSQRQQGLRCA